MHVWYSCAPAYLLSVIIVVQHGLGRMAPRVRLAVAVVILAVFLRQYISRIPKDWGRLPEHVADSRLIPDNYREAIAYLEPRLPPGESLYVLTNEATWFYFVDRPCPTRFPIVYFAGLRRLQKEVIADLEAKKVPYIVYRTPFWSSHVDGVAIEKRIPSIFEYVAKHYGLDREFDGVEIWKRNDVR